MPGGPARERQAPRVPPPRPETHNRAARILEPFFQFLEDKGREVLGAEILAWIDTAEDKVFELANHVVAALLVPCRSIY